MRDWEELTGSSHSAEETETSEDESEDEIYPIELDLGILPNERRCVKVILHTESFSYDFHKKVVTCGLFDAKHRVEPFVPHFSSLETHSSVLFHTIFEYKVAAVERYNSL